MGSGDAAVRLLQLINPAERTRDSSGVEVYRGEPYAVAADVSSSALRIGASGWTWYTGSAGWMYRVWIEDVFGFHLRGNQLLMRPELPDNWPSCAMSFRFHSTHYRVVMERVAPGNVCKIECDGRPAQQGIVKLVDDGKEHVIQIEIGTSDDRSDTESQPDPKVGSIS